MSITKTTFVSTTTADMSEELFEWMKKNAADLFDDISIEVNDVISCKKNEQSILRLFGTYSSRYQHYAVYNMDSSSYILSHSYTGSDNCLYHSAYRTSNGIVLVPYAVALSSQNHRKSALFISTDENGDLIIAGTHHTADTGSTYPEIFTMSPERETAIIKKTNASTDVKALCMQSEKTSFCEVLSRGGRKAPHLFYLPFTQYVNETAVINDGTKEFVTDGFFALEE